MRYLKKWILVLVGSSLLFHAKEKEVGLIPTSFSRVYTNHPTEKIEPQLQTYGKSVALIDGNSGRILYEKNGRQELPMASTTKIMTCMLILEEYDLEKIITVSAQAEKQPKVKLQIRQGEKYCVKDLLYPLMLESDNDVAVALAEGCAGSVDCFVKKMNQKAKELGCIHTHFVTPNGLDATGHYTTAEDLCKIAAYALKNSRFQSIITTQKYSFHEQNTNKSFCVSNKNAFLEMFPGAVGVKTGFTNRAGYCFAGAVKQGNSLFVSATLAAGWPPNKSYKWSDTKQLMTYGIHHFTPMMLYSKFVLPKKRRVWKNRYITVKTKSYHPTLLMDGSELQEVYIEWEKINGAVKKGQEIGKVYYFIDKKIWVIKPIMAAEDAEKKSNNRFFDFKIWR